MALFCLGLYLAATSPLIYWRDSVEFAMIGHNLDIGHPAGSPVFSMFTKFLDLLPIGSIAFRATLFSMLSAFFAISALVFTLFRLAESFRHTGWRLCFGALVAVCAFAFSPAFFDWAIAPEVYAAQVLVVFLLIAMSIELFIQERHGGADRRLLFLAGLILGLGCGVHMGTGLLAPGLAWVLIMPNRSLRRLRSISLFGLFVFIGFSVYIYLPIRAATQPTFNQGNPQTWGLFLGHITGSRYSEIIHSFPWPRILLNLRALAAHFPDQLTWPTLPLAVFGLMFCARRSPHFLIGICLFVFGHLYLYVKDWERAFGYIPLFALAAVLTGVGAVAASHFLSGKKRYFSPWIGISACLIFAFMLFVHQAQRAILERSHSAHDLTHRHARGLLNSLPHDALYVSHQDANSYTIFYAQSVERYREDVVHIQRAFLPLPDYLRERYSSIDWSGYDPQKRFGVYDFLVDQSKVQEAFWDYGWEMRADVPVDGLATHGFIWRIAQDNSFKPDPDRRRLKKYFGQVIAEMDFHPYDFTVREVYARRFSLLAKYMYDHREYEQAESAINRALEIRPQYGQLYAQLGIIEAARGMLDQAWLNGVLATQLEPGHIDNWNYRAQFAIRDKKPDDALFAYEKSLALNRWQSGPALGLAEFLVNKKQYAKAASRAKDALDCAKNERDEHRANNVFARALVGLGQCADALPIITKLKEMNPGDETTQGMLDFCRGQLK